MTKFRAILTALMVAAFALTAAVPATAAAGGIYTWSYPHSKGNVQVSGPTSSSPQVVKTLKPGQEAIGLKQVIFFKVPSNRTVTRWCYDGTKPHGYSVATFKGNVWHKACAGKIKMDLRVN